MVPHIAKLSNRVYNSFVENEFKPLLPVARGHLLRIMATSNDDKLVAGIAKEILELSADRGVAGGVPVVINDSQVVLLVATAKELREYHGGST